MIAFIDGVMVTGSPEEIQRFRDINAKKVKSTNNDFFRIPVSDVPEHVKNYGKHKVDYSLNDKNPLRAWF